jgi:hypothetical protein
MPDYRLYCLGDDGRFRKAHEIAASDDGEAVAKARAMKFQVRCELWERERLVAEIPAHFS